ncbi:Uncharacterized protein SCG7086_BS_00090 [Chlamydiales bacterium SCGC AG-110-P3]|nr:Uncharacterized protein SCG7086_BS_00090 [Chlamydiales bacterium SCGC AG-110-P3]
MTESIEEQRAPQVDTLTTDRKQILFVDDDEKLLAGLKRGMRSMRDAWDVYFASHVNEAMQFLSEGPIDIVIADIRMPEIDGVTFLKTVKSAYPHTLRVVLSGESGNEMGHKALEVANQCLAKPCSVEDLKGIIQEMLTTQNRLGNGILKDAMTQLDTLPSIPQQYWDLKDAIEDPNSSMEGISDVIAKDIAMSAKILQLANSAFFGFSVERITSLSRAITMLGLDLVSQLTMVAHVFAAFDKKTCVRFSIEDLWNHSMRVSYLARKICIEEKVPRNVMEAALLGGLLSEIGKLVFAACVAENYNIFLEDLGKYKNLPIEEELRREQNVFGTTHPEVGAYMVGVWGLPHEIVDAVASHHTPTACISKTGLTPPLAVCAASVIADGNLEGKLATDLNSVLKMSDLSGRFDKWVALDDSVPSSN